MSCDRLRPLRGTRTALLVNARRALRQRANVNSRRAGVHDGCGTAWSIPRRQRPVEPVGGDHADHRADGNGSPGLPDGATRVVVCTAATPGDRQARLGKPVEFRDKGQVVDNASSWITTHAGNPTDATGGPGDPTGQSPNRGWTVPLTVVWRGRHRHPLTDLGVRTVVIPPKGRPVPPANRRETPHIPLNHHWRTGCEADQHSNADTAGTAPAWTASKERNPGADKGSSPTT